MKFECDILEKGVEGGWSEGPGLVRIKCRDKIDLQVVSYQID